jgi:hypothetical protein
LEQGVYPDAPACRERACIRCEGGDSGWVWCGARWVLLVHVCMQSKWQAVDAGAWQLRQTTMCQTPPPQGCKLACTGASKPAALY